MLDFQAEIQAFETALPRLLEKCDGGYAVIHDASIRPETFPTYEDALRWGYQQFGLERFYVKQITDRSHSIHFMRGFAE